MILLGVVERDRITWGIANTHLFVEHTYQRGFLRRTFPPGLFTLLATALARIAVIISNARKLLVGTIRIGRDILFPRHLAMWKDPYTNFMTRQLIFKVRKPTQDGF